jgi:hypothetical protein
VKKIFITIYVLLLLLPLKAQQPFNVQAAALWALSQSDPAEALTLAKTLEKGSKGTLCDAIFLVYTTSGGDPEWAWVYKAFLNKSPQEQFECSERFGDMVAHVRNPVYAQQGIAALKELKYPFDTDEKITAILDHIRNVRLIPHNQ